MRLSIETDTLRERFDDKTAIKMIKDAGFDAYDYSTYDTTERTDMLGEDYRERAMALRRYADEIGIACNQAHEPFGFTAGQAMDMTNPNYCRVVRAIETASILGAENIIVHAVVNTTSQTEDFEEYNRQFYHSLLRHCE